MSVLEQLEPNRVFYYFEQLAAIPHGSRNTKCISDYLVSFAREHELEVIQDELNNVIIIKEASKGYEEAEPIILQGHMDMVCEKDNSADIDFATEGLSLYVDGDFVKAKGTTLGGDDGIAVAYALAILESDEIVHPRLEVVVTVDEEIGMLGAFDIDLSMLKGHRMLNIDSDVEGHFLTSCAGGRSLNAEIPVKRITMTGTKLTIRVDGLKGGHSGGEIDKERANADILMGRVLRTLSDITPFGILSLSGGLKDNAIPRECQAEVLIPDSEVFPFIKGEFYSLDAVLKKELFASDPKVSVCVSKEEHITAEILDYASTSKLVFFLRSVPNGVQNRSMHIEGLVETSSNLGILELRDASVHLVISIRSSVGSKKEDLCDRVCQLVEMVGGEVEIDGDYPAWEYQADSPLREQIAQVYRELYQKEPVFEAIHAGLECGLFSEKIKGLDCVSFGPDNFDIHTPQERLSISSTERVWSFLLAFLKNSCKNK